MSNDEEKAKLFEEVKSFFSPTKFRLILPILLGEDIVAMSTLNYFVTNYSYMFSSYVKVKGKVVYIHKAYKKKLTKYKKFYFDAFCREVKIPFFYEEDKYITTTLGQLNYYRWILELDILTYVRRNHDEIYYHMKHPEENIIEETTDSLTESSIRTDSEMTTSERNRYKNKVLKAKKIEIDDDLN